MRSVTFFFALSSVVLLPRLALAGDPEAPPPAPPAPVLAPPAPVVAPPAPPRSILYVHEDGTPAASASDTATPNRMRNKGLVIGGAVTGFAGLALVIGGVAMAQAATPKQACTDREATFVTIVAGASGALGCGLVNLDYDLQRTGGYTMAAIGGLAIAGGVVMAAVGAMPLNRPTRAQLAKGVPAVGVGPRSATLRWSF